MAVRVFTTKRFAEDCQAVAVDSKVIVKAFREYKTTGVLPNIFGRDEAYRRPAAAVFAELMHVHFSPDGKWRLRSEKLRQFDRTSDAALVYCTGWQSRDSYLLIAFLGRNAHERMQRTTFVTELTEIAEGFRSKY